MIKAIFFDIDGTLLTQDTHVVPDSAQYALRQLHNQGIYLFIASGRPLTHMKLMPSSLLNIPFDGFILLNGQYCVKKDGTVVRDQPIALSSLKALVPWLKEQTFYCSVHELNDGYEIRFNPEQYSYLKSIGRLDQLPKIEDPERSYTHDTYQICPYMPAEMDQEFLKHAPGMESARWTDAFADMIPAGGGKPRGMDAMAGSFGFATEETMAFGDAGNDIGMLKHAHIGVAMGNGTEPARAAADYVTSDIHDNGIYNACVHFGLIAKE